MDHVNFCICIWDEDTLIGPLILDGFGRMHVLFCVKNQQRVLGFSCHVLQWFQLRALFYMCVREHTSLQTPFLFDRGSGCMRLLFQMFDHVCNERCMLGLFGSFVLFRVSLSRSCSLTSPSSRMVRVVVRVVLSPLERP